MCSCGWHADVATTITITSHAMLRPHFQVVLMYKSGDAANEQALEAVIYAEMAVQEAVDLGGMVRARTRM